MQGSGRFIEARLAVTRQDLDEVLSHLADDDMRWAPREGMKSVGDLLLEIARKDHEIVSYLKNGEWPDDDPDPFDAASATLSEAKAGLIATRAATLAYLHSLNPAELDEIITLPERWWESLRLLECPRSEMLRNISAHEWYHTAQLITYLWSRGDNPEEWG
ncbi:MAG: DinB family protein [Fimbriimonadaceae bacterium]